MFYVTPVASTPTFDIVRHRESNLILGAVHKVRHAIFGPPPPCHTLSHIPGPPRKYVTHLGPPNF